jgi:hypothetical protein
MMAAISVANTLTVPAPGRAAAPPRGAARVLAAPFLFTVALAAIAALPSIRAQPVLRGHILLAAAALGAWNGLLLVAAHRRRRPLAIRIALRPQHYLQACAQLTVLLFWGWHWRPVYEAAPLIASQLLFAYVFDMLFTWSRRDAYVFGFGIFPVVFSINLFLWFRPDWFYFQFLMVALGFAAKDLLRWEKDGRQAHIFNPSSFPLAVFSVALLLTGRSAMTFGQEIATTQFYPPHIYLALFLVGLPGQLLFGVTTMTMAAVVTTYAFGLLYYAATGVYFFYDSYIPIAVFLGMHLLFTDPSTSPRTELGRVIFGVLYGLSTIALYSALGRAGLPTFYDKLLQVPLLNLSIKLIDRLGGAPAFRAFDPSRLGRGLVARRRHLAYVAIWAIVFAAMSAAGGVGDEHPGQWLPFWQQACEENRPSACSYAEVLEASYCDRGSGWACNEWAVRQAGTHRDAEGAAASLARGCALGFAAACSNQRALDASGGSPIAATLRRTPPTAHDYPIVLRGSKRDVGDRTPAELSALACRACWGVACGPHAPVFTNVSR